MIGISFPKFLSVSLFALMINHSVANELIDGFKTGCIDSQTNGVNGVYIVEEFLDEMCTCASKNTYSELYENKNFREAWDLKNTEKIRKELFEKNANQILKNAQKICISNISKKYKGIANIVALNKKESAFGASRTPNGGEIAVKKLIFNSCFEAEKNVEKNARNFCGCISDVAYQKIDVNILLSGDSSAIISAKNSCKGW